MPRFLEKPVGNFGMGEPAPDPEMFDKGDVIVIAETGERAMVAGHGSTAYILESIDGRGTFLLTQEEMLAQTFTKEGVDAASVTG